MENRKYNIYFHLHTISGISISVLLFVIFFAGAFTLFQTELNRWEEHSIKSENQQKEVDSKTMIHAYKLANESFKAPYGRSISMYNHEGKLHVNVGPSADTTISKKMQAGKEYEYNTTESKLDNHKDHYRTGTLLYWLHFYWQFGQIGYFISGLVALFFFLAIVTGILVHWKKIWTNFFIFRPGTKWKTIWTDAHTALGVIGLPFQFLYALTGSMFGLGTIVALFAAGAFFNSDSNKMYETLYPRDTTKNGKEIAYTTTDISSYLAKVENRWPGFEITYLEVKNLSSTTARIKIGGALPISDEFLGNGDITYDLKTGKEIASTNPHDTNYLSNSRNWIYRIHYANFGEIGTLSNILLKTAYFLMALLTCFIIITGVMIWLTARDKKGLSKRKHYWNAGVGYFYLSTCLSLFPLVAITLIIGKWWHNHTESQLNNVFFYTWIIVALGLSFIRNNQLIFKITLLSGAIACLLVPIASGVLAGNWIWFTWGAGERGIFAVDTIFLLLSITAFFTYYQLKKKKVSEV